MIDTATFERDLRSAKQARRFVTDRLHGCDSSLVDNAALMTSELVTNSIQYSTGTLTLTLEVAAERVRVAVSDTGPGTPTMQSPRPEEPNGRGLQLVATLADDWGASPNHEGGNTVWFSLNLDSHARGEHRLTEADVRPQPASRKSNSDLHPTRTPRQPPAIHPGLPGQTHPGQALGQLSARVKMFREVAHVESIERSAEQARHGEFDLVRLRQP